VFTPDVAIGQSIRALFDFKRIWPDENNLFTLKHKALWFNPASALFLDCHFEIQSAFYK